MVSWRITKYDPKDRDQNGVFLKESWTSFSDVGKVVDGSKVTVEDYIRVEDAYIQAVKAFFEPVKPIPVTFCDLEYMDHIEALAEMQGKYPTFYSPELLRLFTTLSDGCRLDYNQIDPLCRLILREHIWGKMMLEDKHHRMFAHFGYDYYMYLGSNHSDKQVLSKIKKTGLYIEPYRSPYL